MGRVFRCFCSSSLFMRWIAVLKKNATKNSSVPSVLIIFRAEIYSERFLVLIISKGWLALRSMKLESKRPVLPLPQLQAEAVEDDADAAEGHEG